jgi:hypothetical protein
MRATSPVRAALAAVALIAGTVLGTATPVSAASCPSTKDTKIDGAVAHWTLSCKQRHLHVDGWVQDTRADAMCARVTIDTKERGDWPQACGSGKRVTFHKSHFNVTTATVKLQVVY